METKRIDVNEIKDANIKKLVIEVGEALEERGYDAYEQLTGYLITGDLAYITNHKEARNKIQQVNRFELLKTILKDYTVF